MSEEKQRDDDSFEMVIFGRIIEHLGSMMYKQRPTAIAELVANCWDAGAKNVWITIPNESEYDKEKSEIVIMDDGYGMTVDEVQKQYLMIGRDRRKEEIAGESSAHNRRIMGRKGIGKLAGFGIAGVVRLTTWKCGDSKATWFEMPMEKLNKAKAGSADSIRFPRRTKEKESGWPESGTIVALQQLRHPTPISLESLRETLSRRFSRTVHQEMNIWINREKTGEPSIETTYAFPDDGSFCEEKLEDGKTVKFRYRFSRKPIQSKEMQGFTIQTNERTSQAPPFFFNVESTASSQHSTRYVSGEIIADFVDEETGDSDDKISTDRQEIDWESGELSSFKKWGEKFSRDTLRKCAEMRGDKMKDWILSDKEFKPRIDALEPESKEQISRFLRILGQKVSQDDEKIRDLADSLIRAYEFRVFHDVVGDLNDIGDDPEKLEDILKKLHDWKVLESRATLEIVAGRLEIIRKLRKMIIENAPETASSKTHDNMHDLLAGYPWLINPEWSLFTEEKSIGKILREWGEGTGNLPKEDARMRVDFLAFKRSKEESLFIIEIKRYGHAVTYEEVQRLESYQVKLMSSQRNVRAVLIFSGTHNIPEEKMNDLKKSGTIEFVEWCEMFNRAERFYAHYAAILEGDAADPGFLQKKNEVIQIRNTMEYGSYRSPEERKEGLGNNDP